MKTQLKFVAAFLATLLLAACANQMEPAQKAIAQIDAALTATGSDAVKYVPNKVEDVNRKFADLKAAYERKDYKAVLAGAPAVLAEAKALAAETAAKKDEYLKLLGEQWTKLSAAMPQSVAAIESRLAELKKSRKLPAGVTKDAVAAAGPGLEQVKAAWNEATSAFGAGKVEEAVAKARGLQPRVDEIMLSLGLKPLG